VEPRFNLGLFFPCLHFCHCALKPEYSNGCDECPEGALDALVAGKA
jgi:hypothetical protein